MTKVKIQPVKIFPDEATQLEISGASVKKFGPEGEAFVFWSLKDSKGKILKSGAENLKGSDYQAWSDDLPYLTTWLINRLGLIAA